MMKTTLLTLFLMSLSINCFAECVDLTDCLDAVQEITVGQDISDCPVMDNAGNPDQNELIGNTEQFQITFEQSRNHPYSLDPNARKYLTAGIASAPVAFLAGVSLHEGMHCAAAEIVESTYCKEIVVIPFRDEETGYFYFGLTRWGFNEEGIYPSMNENAFITALPMITNAGLITAYSTLAFTNKLPKNKWAKTGLLVLAATQVVDLGNHIRNTSPYSDSGKLMYYMQTQNGLDNSQSYNRVKGPQIGFATLGAGAIAVEGFRIFTNRNERSDSNFNFMPSIGTDGFNLNISGKF